MLSNSNILKVSLFATGLSGIVAEYVLSTLATYFLGNSVLQWTLILSTMLFAMGLGSRFSRYIERNVLEKFIGIEFLLSLLVSFCAVIAYEASAYVSQASFSGQGENLSIYSFPYDGVVIYAMSFLIGLLIGMEIPMVTRLNEAYESLKVNISNVMENDYYGSLVGGVFFAFVGLPYLGLTYTPFLLGSINLAVACWLLWLLWGEVGHGARRVLLGAALAIAAGVGLGALNAETIINRGEQQKYRDHVIFQRQTAHQRVVITEWKGQYWFYLNGNLQLSSYDEWLYHEPLVHPAMMLAQHARSVLVLGGGDGCAVRELLKYPQVERVLLVDLDPEITRLAQSHYVFLGMNGGALADPRVEIVNADAFNYLEKTQELFDAMIIDFPDPKSIELGRLYSQEFYRMCYNQLRPNGMLVTQAGSPYYATKAFRCIEKTVGAAGFHTLPLHNQVLSMGEWGWVLGSKRLDGPAMKQALNGMALDQIELRWLNPDAMRLITSFGKDLVPVDTANIRINRIHEPVLPDYYREGNWDFFAY
jgi:spermidine synthase